MFQSIDQNSLAEKSQQVQIISTIFERADRVLAWVGEHAEGSEQLFQPSPGSISKSTLFSHLRHRFSSSDDEKQALLHRAKLWCVFFSRPYFTRTWVVQEVGLAQAITVHCGPDSLSWNQLIGERMQHKNYFDGLATGHAGRLATIQPETSRFHDTSDSPAGIMRIERLKHAVLLLGEKMIPIRLLHALITNDRKLFQYNRNIFEIIDLFAYTRCSIAQDRVYALLSLEQPSGWGNYQFPIPVDYEAGMHGMVASLYQCRFVEDPQPWPRRNKEKDRSQASLMVFALRLNGQQCQEVLDEMALRMQRDADTRNQDRWNYAYELFLGAANHARQVAEMAEKTGDNGRLKRTLGDGPEMYSWV